MELICEGARMSTLGAREDESTTSSREGTKVAMFRRQEGRHPELDGRPTGEATMDSLGAGGPTLGKRLFGEI